MDLQGKILRTIRIDEGQHEAHPVPAGSESQHFDEAIALFLRGIASKKKNAQ
jgi:hypothetical protein